MADGKPGAAGAPGGGPSPQPAPPKGPKRYKPVEIPTPAQIVQDDVMNHPIMRMAISGVMGFAMGGCLGFMFGSFDGSEELNQKPMREVLKKMGKEAGSRAWGHAKMFGEIGILFAGSEAVIETVRAKHDIYNSAGAGCFSGAVLARGSGPMGIGFGCASFAAFSAAMEHFMSSE